MDKLYKIFKEVEEDLKFIATSGVRIKMLNSLLEKPKTSSELKDEFKIGASTIIHAARDLEKEGYIKEEMDGYHLTTVGKIATLKLIEMMKTLYVLKREKNFWLTHKIEDIPEEFIKEIYKLYDGEVLKSSIRNVFKTLSIYMELTQRAKVFYGVSPIFVNAFVPLIKKLLKRGTETKLVLTEEVFDELKKIDKKGLKELLEHAKLSIWIIKETPKVAFTVTDSVLSIGLFDESGMYDPTYDLISKDKEAIEWGRKLFEYYKSKARKVHPQDIE